MKKVLSLVYDFPPYVSVGGLRPHNWYKYLKEFGVEPVIITRQWDNEYGNELDYIAPSKSKETIIEHSTSGTIYRSPYLPNLSNRILLKHGNHRFKIFRKIITAYYEFAQFFYVTGTKKELYSAAQDYLRENKVDAIIATGEPFVLFSFASKLSKEFNTPWIADYRDLWSQYGDVEKNTALKLFYRFFEKRIMRNVNQITTVSEFLEHKIQSLGIDKKFHLLPNGFDHELIDEVAQIEPKNDCLNIAFVGSIYEWHPWQSFILNFCKYINEHPKAELKVNFYGVSGKERIESFIMDNHPELKDYFTFTPRIPNREVLERLAENNVMLLFNYYSYMGTKIFDYLGVKRKIILCYSDDKEANRLKEKYYGIEEIEGISKTLQADLIAATKSGIVVKDAVHLSYVLDDLWQEFVEKGEIECNSIGVEKFSRKEQVEKLAGIIKGLD